ncbi:MAG: hypothetical protein H8E44_24130 [Planctomycetes bacterium]|nr:hypothetical protein [Planctomycetota bacterium]MBL7042440.1 hypothetical protein [Pirellulaceae bacterium]
MEIMVLIILIGVVLIDGKLWKVVLEQRRHNRRVEQLLAEIRANVTGQPMFGIWRILQDSTTDGDWWRGAGEDSPAVWFPSREEAESKAEELAKTQGHNASFEVRLLNEKV